MPQLLIKGNDPHLSWFSSIHYSVDKDMSKLKSICQTSLAAFVSLLVVSALSGCGYTEPAYSLNSVYVLLQEKSGIGDLDRSQQENIADVLGAAFGTPDDPQLPDVAGIGDFIDIDKLYVAAGKVGRDANGAKRGLYREHCVHCHGINGDGVGPTAAFLNPYPRDYRRGIFKFKSTLGPSVPPTHEDLHRILYDGVAGTAMPSFKVLDEGEIDALVHYVKYLSLRGQVERALIGLSADELEPADPETGAKAQLLVDVSDPAQAQAGVAATKNAVESVVTSWMSAQPVPVPSPPSNFGTKESMAEGRRLFFTTLTNCSKCHGETALGDGQLTDYDEWTKEWVGDGKNLENIEEYEAAGALPPRNIRPRNLRAGIFRGGRRPIDLYWRVKNGIAGTPMPAASGQLSDDDLWHVVDYVRSLQYDKLSQPGHVPDFQRERN